MTKKIDSKKYQSVHYFLCKKFGNANKCENVKCEGSCYRFEWALRKGFDYEVNASNFIMLCTKCHRRYDQVGVNLSKEHSKKISDSNKGRVFTKIHCENLSLSSKNKTLSENFLVSNCKKLLDTRTNIVYKSISFAAIELGLNRRTLNYQILKSKSALVYL